MNLLRFIPIKLTLFLVLGILLGRYLQPAIAFPLTFTGACLTLLGALFYQENRMRSFAHNGKGSLRFGIVAALTTISIGVLAVSLADTKNTADHYSHKQLAEKQVWKIKINEELKSTLYSNRYLAKVLGRGDDKVSGFVLLSISVDTEDAVLSNPKHSANLSHAKTDIHRRLQVDDELLLYGHLNPIKAPLNPHQFDYRKYLRNLGVTHQVCLSAGHFVIEKNPEPTVFGIAANARHQIIDKLRKANFGKEELGIIQALLLGSRNDISSKTYDNYKNAGAVHILAVSGLHIGILLLLLQFLLRPLELLPDGKTVKLVVVVTLLWGFALLAGLSASVVRAVTMFSFVAYALYLNRPGNTFNILALSMFFILLLVDPLLLFQVGFQMSYAAVFSIVWIYPLLQRLWNPRNRIVRYFWQLLSVSIAAQAGVLPISLFYFHQFPGLFFISNLLIVPALGLILGIGILVIFLALLNQLPESLVTGYDTLIRWMNQIIGWVAQQEAFVFRSISFDGVQLVLVYGILLTLILFLSKPNFRKAVALCSTIIGFQLWLFHTSYRTHKKETLFVAHQTRNSILMHQKGSHLFTIAQDSIRLQQLASDYKVAERIASVGLFPLKNSYRWGDKNILVIDSLGVYQSIANRTDYLLLTGSPKLNLERLIDSIHPKTIIADGSNYRSYVSRWKKTCKERTVPFHNTGEKGAFFLKRTQQ
ncbi:MAG: ComEC/Rec2 family competence protein [Pricia sp.]